MATRTKLTYDDRTGIVRIRLIERTGPKRHARSVAVLPIPRADIRALSDAIHDFADDLDRKDRNA
ncbi:hypothetical protein [Microbacterium sp. C7(2022)]|uniref:hypothetical protein n=1 Tax=Microbacterium sp. C7(2022) TaxID=2992759 RepID=UPI00237A7952|nr:hypothetical protein [Microbacterium sp. C7(2022)]MDE0545484.1 hypothetical protein [Microbacterium sp. C7(2022)]